MKVFKLFLFLALPVYLRLAGQDVSNGLIGHWQFDETAGTTARILPEQHHAQLFNAGSGAGSWVDGKVNGGIKLDGPTIISPFKVSITPSRADSALTVVAWLKTSATSQRPP